MRATRVSHLLLVAATYFPAADQAPTPSPIRLPSGPVAPTPAPTPNGTTTLTSDQLYVIDSDVPIVVLTSPAGIVTTSEDVGPVKIRGKFVDGVGKAETRVYKGKQVVTVEAVTTGKVELLIVPVGGVAADVVRRTIDVTVNQLPIPPPKPKPDPTPVDPVITPTALWGFVVVEETADAVAQRGLLLADPTLAALMKAKGYHWRMVDKDVVATDGKPPVDVLPMLNASKGKMLPQVFIVDAKGNVLTQAALGNAVSVVALLKQFGG